MKNTQRFFVLFSILFVLLLSGCNSIPLAPESEDTLAKNFQPVPNKAKIYLYRNEFFGSQLKMPVTIDGKIIGHTLGNTYFMIEVEPGSHTIQSLTEDVVSMDIDTDAGKNYYVWQEVKMGLVSGRSLLHLVSEEDGQKGVNECKLAVALSAE